jgi:hypothetical protein
MNDLNVTLFIIILIIWCKLSLLCLIKYNEFAYFISEQSLSNANLNHHINHFLLPCLPFFCTVSSFYSTLCFFGAYFSSNALRNDLFDLFFITNANYFSDFSRYSFCLLNYYVSSFNDRTLFFVLSNILYFFRLLLAIFSSKNWIYRGISSFRLNGIDYNNAVISPLVLS